VNMANALSATLSIQSSRDAATVQSYSIGSLGRDWGAGDEVDEATTGGGGRGGAERGGAERGGAEREGACWVAIFD
jgi:hypothetical protein